MIEISVVIPVYNNSLSIDKLFERISIIVQKLKKNGKEVELIFVDDGSEDSSFSKIENIKKENENIKIIKLIKNYGANEAVQIGLQNAKGNYVSILSADLQDEPELILKMYEVCSNDIKLVICERESRSDSLITKIFAKIFYLVLKKSVIKDYPKNGFDIFMISRELLNKVNLKTINPTISLMIISLGLKYKTIFYDRQKRDYGKSEWTLSKKLNFFWNIFIRYSDLPIKFISRVGLIISILSFLYGIYIILIKLILGFPVPGFATIVSSITFFSGLIIFMLGIMGEYLIRIFKILDNNENIIIEKIYD